MTGQSGVIFSEGQKRPTIKTVAQLAGVGTKTVSRVINDEPNVSQATAKKVRAAIASLDYRPNTVASSLRRMDRRSKTIGMLVSNVENPFSALLHRGLESTSRPKHTLVFVSSLEECGDFEQEAVRVFVERRVDGLVMVPVSENQEYLGSELTRGTPIVFVDREPVGVNADVVMSNNFGGAVAATEHLIRYGHRRIAFLGDDPRIQTARERHQGFVDALQRANVRVDEKLVLFDALGEVAARSCVRRMLEGVDPPTAIFAAQNMLTIGAIRALRDADKQASVALVGFDDFQLADMLQPGITVVAQDPEEIGRVAAELIFAKLDGQSKPGDIERSKILIPTRLILRGSGELTPQM